MTAEENCPLIISYTADCLKVLLEKKIPSTVSVTGYPVWKQHFLAGNKADKLNNVKTMVSETTLNLFIFHSLSFFNSCLINAWPTLVCLPFCKIELKSRLMVCTRFLLWLKTWTSDYVTELGAVCINFVQCIYVSFHMLYQSNLFFVGEEHFQSGHAITQTVHIKDKFA